MLGTTLASPTATLADTATLENLGMIVISINVSERIEERMSRIWWLYWYFQEKYFVENRIEDGEIIP